MHEAASISARASRSVEVVDCTDAPPIRYLLNDAALSAGRPRDPAASLARVR